MATQAQIVAEARKALEKIVPSVKSTGQLTRGSAAEKAALETAKQKALVTLSKQATTEVRKQALVDSFGASALALVGKVSNAPSTQAAPVQTNITTKITQAAKNKAINAVVDAIYQPSGSGTGVQLLNPSIYDKATDSVIIQINTDLVNRRIDDLINSIFVEVDVSDFTLADRQKYENLDDYRQRLNAANALVDANVLSTHSVLDQAIHEKQAAEIEYYKVAALKYKVDAVVKFEQLIKDRTKELNEWIIDDTFSPEIKKQITDKVQEASRIIEQSLIRNVPIKDGLILNLQQGMVDIFNRISAKEKELASKVTVDTTKKDQVKNALSTFLEQLGGGISADSEAVGQVFTSDIPKALSDLFKSTPQNWEKIYIDQALGQKAAIEKLKVMGLAQ